MEREHAEALHAKWLLKLPQPVETSSGPTTEYLDGIGMLLDDPVFWRAYFERRLPRGAVPIAQGASGATILGILGRGALMRSPLKMYGIEMHGRGPEGPGPLDVAIVDDCSFTGATIAQLRLRAQGLGWNVVAIVTAWPWVPLG